MTRGGVSAPVLFRIVIELKHELADALGSFPKLVNELESDMGRCESTGEQASIVIHLLYAMHDVTHRMDGIITRALASLGVESNGKDSGNGN